MRHDFSPGLPNQGSHPVFHFAGDSSVRQQLTIAAGHMSYISRHAGIIDQFEE